MKKLLITSAVFISLLASNLGANATDLDTNRNINPMLIGYFVNVDCSVLPGQTWEEMFASYSAGTLAANRCVFGDQKLSYSDFLTPAGIAYWVQEKARSEYEFNEMAFYTVSI